MTNLIVDPVNNRNGHYQINKLFIIALSDNKQKNILLLSNDQYIDRGYSGTLFGSNKFSYILFSLNIYLNMMFILLTKKIDKVYFLAVDNFIFPKLILILRFIYSNQIYVIIHNNLESLKFNEKSKYWENIDTRYNITFIVLSPFLKKILRDELNINNMLVMKHPTYVELYNFDENKRFLERTIDYTFLGSAAYEAKETGFLVEFLNIINKLSNKVIIVALPFAYYHSSPNIKILNYGFRPDLNSYSKLIFNSRFLVICNSRRNRLTASGVLADALTHGTPLIAPNKPPWNEHIPSIMQQFLFNEDNLEEIVGLTINNANRFEGITSIIQDYSLNYTSNYLKQVLKI